MTTLEITLKRMTRRRQWLAPRPDDHYQRIATLDLFDSRWRPHYNYPLLLAVELGARL